MNTYTLFWLDGKSEPVKGTDPASAMNNAGYGAGALRALDFYMNGDAREDYNWNSAERKWSRIIPDAAHAAYSEFIQNLPEQLGMSVEEGNRIFARLKASKLQEIAKNFNIPLFILEEFYKD